MMTACYELKRLVYFGRPKSTPSNALNGRSNRRCDRPCVGRGLFAKEVEPNPAELIVLRRDSPRVPGLFEVPWRNVCQCLEFVEIAEWHCQIGYLCIAE